MISQQLNVAIVGGGVCGLTLAIALQKQGIKAHIYEAASKFDEVGAGIGISANGLTVLREIGAYDELVKYMPDPSKLNVLGIQCAYASEGHENIYDIVSDGTKSAAAVHRTTFLDVLIKFIDPEYTHFNKRCVSITNDKTQVMHFADGTSAHADVVLFANGIKSWARGVVVADADTNGMSSAPQETEVDTRGMAFSNTACYRGLVTQQQAQALGVDLSIWREPTNLIAKDKHIIIYPINRGQFINIVAYSSDHSKPVGSVQLPPSSSSQTVTSEELLAAFPEPDFSAAARDLLKCIPQPSKWYINIVYPHLKTYAKGRIALLGDAAHGMLPHLGCGAGQGMEDAYLLAQLLSHPQTTADNVEKILQVYSDVRRPRSQRIVQQSIDTGFVYEGRGARGFTKEGLLQDLKEVEGWMDEGYTYIVGKEVGEALDLLKQRGVFF